LGEYFNNADLTAPVMRRIDPAIFFNWNSGSPAASLAPGTFSIRWTGKILAATTDVYTFYVNSDDGVRLWIGGKLVIDAWVDQGMTEHRGTIPMTAGLFTDIRLEYYQNGGLAGVQLRWSSSTLLKTLVQKADFFPPPGAADAGVLAEAGSPPPPSGTQKRPSYNTGTGFFVVGNKLYDANGHEFRMRGVNHLHWDAPGIGIPKTGSNTERWVIDMHQPTATNLGLMQKSIGNKIVPMAGNWTGTCDQDTSTLSTIVSNWVATASTWKNVEKYLLINIANEWGPSSSTVWRDAYISAVSQLRAAGINCTLVIDAGGCGQDNADLVQYAAAVFDSDPQKNIVFDQHLYGGWANGNAASWQTDLKKGLDALVATGLPVILGEFGPGRNIGPSPTMLTPGEIIQAAEARGFGWLAWAWDDPAGEFTATPNDNWFALSFTGDYRSSADLTTFGKDVVENPTYGTKVLGTPATSF
jgi:hypothetical protein